MTDISPPPLTAQEQAWLAQEDAHVADTIRCHGVCLQIIGGGTCAVPGCGCSTEGSLPFAYTIGLFGIAHPELVVVGLRMPVLATVLNEAASLVLDGARLLPGMEIELTRWDRRLLVEEVPNPGDIAFGANRHYQRPREASVPLLQLSWADRRGRFPMDPAFSGSKRTQPRPGTWDAW
ncbi:DUF4262 domain-containing protein [Microbacterium memoriense]|uniref:DUF4262 domain-containing protein n=1 Tax=Microbacterium memoriense TaxID=2978350 RepID=A0ABT2PEH6_9MICO|nr:DUF4262 domain-containing protein [Microbacterium memoriense]MCT9002248.1 DUF4262 domain-containing protein [Microbacterium memoriense]